MTLLWMLLIYVAGVAFGWSVCGARAERELTEARRLRDEAWDLAHGVSEKDSQP